MIFLVATFGLIAGGFLNSFAYRLEKSKNPFAPIHCRHCDTQLKLIDVIPVFSWLIFGGRCRYCGIKLPIFYPLLEILMMGYCIAVYRYFDPNMEAALVLTLGFCAIALSLVDIRALRLPNNLILFMGLMGVIWCFSSPSKAFINVGLLVSVGLGLKLLCEKFLHSPSLGWGDIKLMAISGLWIETIDIPLYFVLAGGLGILTALIWHHRRKSRVFPFAPSLSMALLISTWTSYFQ